jgi:VWFA-related protein
MFRALLTFALVASALLAQGPAPARLVRLHAVALDASGQPVSDLAPDDFKITDQNKPASAVAFHKPGHELAAPAEPLTFTNRSSKAEPQTTVILFDMINMISADQQENWKALDKAIPQIESGANLYFYLLNLEGALVPIHPLGPPAADDKTWLQNVAGAFDKAMKASSHVRPSQNGGEEQQKRTFKALEDIANKLAFIPGHRDILWVTNGLTTVNDPKLVGCTGDWVECALYVPHLAVTLAGDGVSVDPYALIGNLSANANYNLEQMAALTGGRFYSREEIKNVVNEVAQGAAGGYTIFYDPGADSWNNKWRRIHLTCERKGVKLQFRQRYYAVADSRTPVERMKAVLTTGFQSPTDLAEIGLRAKLSPLPGNAPGMHIQIRIDPTDLVLRDQGGKYAGALYCLISDRSASGPLGEPAVLDLKPELTADQYKTVMKEGLPFEQDHPTTAPLVRVIVLDQNTNQVGSVTFPVK